MDITDELMTLRQLNLNLENRLSELERDLETAEAERAALQEKLDQIREQHRAIMEEPCGDEKHCTCVPVLLEHVAELEKRLLAIRRIGEVCGKHDFCSSDFHHAMSIAAGGKTTDWLLDNREALAAENDALQARVRVLEEDARVLSDALVMPNLAEFVDDEPEWHREAWQKLTRVMGKYIPEGDMEFEALQKVLGIAPGEGNE
jgi:cell division protein FtsB